MSKRTAFILLCFAAIFIALFYVLAISVEALTGATGLWIITGIILVWLFSQTKNAPD